MNVRLKKNVNYFVKYSEEMNSDYSINIFIRVLFLDGYTTWNGTLTMSPYKEYLQANKIFYIRSFLLMMQTYLICVLWPYIPNRSYGFLQYASFNTKTVKRIYTRNPNRTSTCAFDVFCISCRDFTSHTSPGQY